MEVSEMVEEADNVLMPPALPLFQRDKKRDIYRICV